MVAWHQAHISPNPTMNLPVLQREELSLQGGHVPCNLVASRQEGMWQSHPGRAINKWTNGQKISCYVLGMRIHTHTHTLTGLGVFFLVYKFLNSTVLKGVRVIHVLKLNWPWLTLDSCFCCCQLAVLYGIWVAKHNFIKKKKYTVQPSILNTMSIFHCIL